MQQSIIRNHFIDIFFQVLLGAILGLWAIQLLVPGMGSLLWHSLKLNLILVDYSQKFCANIAPAHLDDVTDCRVLCTVQMER